MRFLITGGAGFIGSHLAERLLDLDHEVTIVDDLSTGSVDNVAHLKERKHFRYFFDSIFNRGLTAELVDHCDTVIHLAAAVGVRRIVDHPVETIEINVRGTELVLELAAKKLKRVILASTSEVYGKSTKFPFSEEDDLVMGASSNCRWGYACSKAIDEFLALAYFREKKLPVTILRFFNTTGPRQSGRYGMVLPTFVQQALAHQPVTVYGTGKQARCFGHVADIIEGVIACVPLANTHGEVFNLGNPEEITINDLAKRVVQMSGSSSSIVHIPYAEAYGPGFEDMERRVPDISKAARFFAYQPTRKLEEIIESVIAHERQKGVRVAQLSPR